MGKSAPWQQPVTVSVLFQPAIVLPLPQPPALFPPFSPALSQPRIWSHLLMQSVDFGQGSGAGAVVMR